MGKHDKHIAESSEEFLQNRINDLEKRLAFAEETVKNLQEQCGRMSKWASEIEANAKDAVAQKDKEIRILKDKILQLVNDYVGRE